MNAGWRFNGLGHPITRRGAPHVSTLSVATPAGQLRTVELTRADLYKILAEVTRELRMGEGVDA